MSNQINPSKMYLGNLQEKTWPNGEKFLTGTICLDDVEKVPAEHIQEWKNGKRYLRIIVNPYKSGANQYGNTHSVSVDTFKKQEDKQDENKQEYV